MARIVSVHSFRGGTGKSNITANVAFLLALSGRSVGVIDTDIQSPGIHILFGLEGSEITCSLNDYLWHGRDITETALDVTPSLTADMGGRLFLIPSSTEPGQISRVLREGYDAERLTRGLRELVDRLNLDSLLIDTHPGLNEETLLSLIISNMLVIIMRPDKQDYEGTDITMRVARQLEVPISTIVINKAPTNLEPEAIAIKVKQIYDCEVIAVLPHSEEMLNLGSDGLFSVHFPEHQLTSLFKQIAQELDG
ncbi:MAG: MinD/ParA family protein [Chloroflexota bacterium]|nr:MAG: MinD/ParA family protein [Chloroflexota bacterium]